MDRFGGRNAVVVGFDIRHLHLEQMKVYSEPERDPRGPIISISFLAVVPGNDPKAEHLQADTDAADARWFDIEDLQNVGFDHDKIATAGIGRLLRRVLEDPLTRRIIPHLCCSALMILPRRCGCPTFPTPDATHHGRSDGASSKCRVRPVQESERLSNPSLEPTANAMEDSRFKERLGRLYELMAADSRPDVPTFGHVASQTFICRAPTIFERCSMNPSIEATSAAESQS